MGQVWSRSPRLGILALAIGVGLGTSGCALFQSSGSISDSSGSLSDSSESSSDSSESSRSSSGDDESAYQDDVRAYTVAHVAAEGSAESLRLGLSEVALARGVSDWEALTDTYAAVGEGLAEAGVDEDTLEEYERIFQSGGAPGLEALREGYASGSP